jgi:hypothetical protein
VIRDLKEQLVDVNGAKIREDLRTDWTRDVRVIVPRPVPLEDLELRRNTVAVVDGDKLVNYCSRGRDLAHKNVGSIAITVEESDVKECDLLDFKITVNKATR